MLGISPTKEADEYLEKLAEELSVSDSAYEAAERSYTSLGEWLDREESTLRQYDPTVYVQGSFRLGTAIKPLSVEDEYDLDSVCQLDNLSKSQLSQERLKSLVGKEVESYRKSKGMVKPLEEGKRCWTLKYSDGAQFHMDILPALPNGAEQLLLLDKAGMDSSHSNTAIAITDNQRDNYSEIDLDWNRSNPKGYSDWFKSQMAAILQKRKRMLAEKVEANVEDIPDHKVRTPLQSAVMILKRHRDIMFNDDKEGKPISIIISTLSAHAYDGEENISGALLSILARMDDPQYLERRHGEYWISNPIDATENFADKWAANQQPERATNFFNWLEQARADFGAAARMVEKSEISESLAKRIGVETAANTLTRTRKKPASLLRGASVAAAANAAPSFANTPGKPSKPKGFA